MVYYPSQMPPLATVEDLRKFCEEEFRRISQTRAEQEGLWQTYTATLTPGAGTITAHTQDFAFLELGNTVLWRGRLGITTAGTAAGQSVEVSLPSGHTLRGAFAPTIQEVGAVGVPYLGHGAAGATKVNTLSNSGGGWIQSGRAIVLMGVYERTL